MTAIPVKNVGIGFMTVAGKAGWDTVFGDTQSSAGARKNVINGFGRFTAINTTLTGVCV